VSPAPHPLCVGPYEILVKLGGGGMATVFLGRRVDEHGKEELAAIKVMLPDLVKEAQFVAMFDDEAKILSRLDHPNINRTLGAGHADHTSYIALEVLLGRTLADAWEVASAKQVRFRFDMAAWVCAQVARALHYAHELKDSAGEPYNLVHRDVNPSNIFLGYDGSIKLLDFGLAKARGSKAQTMAGVVKGKIPYLSPEQLVQATLDRRCDVFSLGTTLWEMTTMTRLFKRPSDIDTIIAIRDTNVPDPRPRVVGYPDELWEIVRRALAKDREQRYATALEMQCDLEAFVAARGGVQMGAFVGALLDRLFPGERERQHRWLQRTAAMPASMDVPSLAPPVPLVSVANLKLDPLVLAAAGRLEDE
jgi:serine/threonine-protein kinase